MIEIIKRHLTGIQKQPSGDAKAQYKLGVMYQFGIVVEKDYKKHILFKLAQKRDKTAEFNLRCINNPVNFLTLLLKDRKINISVMYKVGVEKNINKAIKYFENAAKEGNANAQYHLGAYQDGNGVNKNYKQAKEWFEKVAKKGQLKIT